jgi:hypothetical protein
VCDRLDSLRRKRRCFTGAVANHIIFRHPTAGSAAGNCGNIDAARFGETTGDRRRRHSGASAVVERHCRFFHLLRDHSQQFADGHRGAIRLEDTTQNTRPGCGHFDRHLVGFEFDQHLTRSNWIALVFVPCPDRRLDNRLTQGRDFDFDSHRLLVLSILFDSWRTQRFGD